MTERRAAIAQIYLSAVSVGEIQAGIELTRGQDEAKALQIEAWLERVAASYNVLAMDAPAFRAWARLMHRKSDTLYEDAMIAATAKVHGLTVVTRNVADFKAFGVPLLNPFKAHCCKTRRPPAASRSQCSPFRPGAARGARRTARNHGQN